MVYSTCLFETYGKEYTPRLIRLISSPGDDVKGQAVGEIHCENTHRVAHQLATGVRSETVETCPAVPVTWTGTLLLGG